MHIFFTTRGIKHRVDQFINDLLAQYLPYEVQKGRPKQWLQLAVRPIQLWEVVFPEDQKEVVLGMLGPDDGGGSKMPFKSFIRKLLRLKPIKMKKRPDTHHGQYRVFRRDISLNYIGEKKDKYVDGVEQL